MALPFALILRRECHEDHAEVGGIAGEAESADRRTAQERPGLVLCEQTLTSASIWLVYDKEAPCGAWTRIMM